MDVEVDWLPTFGGTVILIFIMIVQVWTSTATDKFPTIPHSQQH